MEVMMESVTGNLSYSINVHCPNCDGRLDLNDYPYEDTDNELGMALFGSTTKPASWARLEISFQCTHCKKDFILTDIEY